MQGNQGDKLSVRFFSLLETKREKREGREENRRGGQRQAKCDKKDKWDGLSRKCSVS